LAQAHVSGVSAMARADVRKVSAAELVSHRTEHDCWIAFHGSVFEVSSFLSEHPGGKQVLMEVAGADGTRAFQAIHPQSMLEKLPAGSKVGVINAVEEAKAQLAPLAGAKSSASASVSCFACLQALGSLLRRPREEVASASRKVKFTTLDHIINVNDFELAAQERMQKTGYDYYASAACDEVTKRANCEAYSRLWLRPRVMVDVSSVDVSCVLLGCPSSLPLFISPSAMAGMAHPDAEVGLARAAGKAGIIQCIANMATRDLEAITGARLPGQQQWYQVYVNPDRSKTEAMLQRVLATGLTALLVTVDTNVIGRRERDQRNKVQDKTNVALVQKTGQSTSGGVIGALGTFTDARLSWKDLAWLRSVTAGRMKLVLKGVQTGEDAVLAAQNGLDGIVISNHGGRQLDHARPTLEVLAEVTAALGSAGLAGSLEVFVDGGIRRGTDIYKALALGAKAVGIGRPALYSLAFGQPGVEKCLQLLQDEFINCMQLMGKTSLAEISAADVVWKPLVAA